jgi:hypothetical protein
VSAWLEGVSFSSHVNAVPSWIVQRYSAEKLAHGVELFGKKIEHEGKFIK